MDTYASKFLNFLGAITSRFLTPTNPLLYRSLFTTMVFLMIMRLLPASFLALEAIYAGAFTVVSQSRQQQQQQQRPHSTSSSSSALSSSLFGNPDGPREQQQARVSSVAFASMAGVGGGGPLQTAQGVPRGKQWMDKAVWRDSSSPPVTVQGGALRTWAFLRPGVERVRILLNTESRPLNANLELWHGPDNTPQKVAVYLEDGNLRSFSPVIETPQDHNAIAVYNTGRLEFPFWASVEPELGSGATVGIAATLQSFSDTCVSPRQFKEGPSIPFPFRLPSKASPCY